MPKLNFKTKLIGSFLIIGILPALVISFYNFFEVKTEISKEMDNKLSAILHSKNIEMNKYLQGIKKQVKTYSHDPAIEDAAVAFIDAYNNVDVKATPRMKKIVKDFYISEFQAKYKNDVGTEVALSKLMSDLTDKDYVMQYAFIANNKHPLGEKHNLIQTDVLPDYSAIHAKYHPSIAEYLTEFEYYDIFIVDKDSGNIVYSVFKELDYSTSLKDGPYRDSNFARAYREALEINDKESVAFVDFEKYTPSYDAPASFIASPIWKDGKKVAVLIFQMPVGAINSLMAQKKGMGETGEIYLVGQDKLLRSDTRNNKEMNIVDSFRKNLKVDSSVFAKSSKVDVLSGISSNYDGTDVLFSSEKVKFEGVEWMMIAEASLDEVQAGVFAIKMHSSIFLLISSLLVAVFGYYMSNGLAKSIIGITEDLSESSHAVQNASQSLSLASEQMNKSIENQSESIYETASSLDEISAMLLRSSESSESAKDMSETTRKSAEAGVEIVENMLAEIKLISESYDKIATSIESNNEDIGQIVNVISEISEKTGVINDIVFQTKLLSFNASVEAARAGEHGKGFAVVAEEVGNLAQMSGNAADEIMGMLSNSITKVNEIAEKTKTEVTGIVNSGKSQVEKGSSVAVECKERLEDIANHFSRLDSSIVQIAEASREQESGVSEIKNAIRILEESTMTSKKTSQTTEKSSISLLNQSKGLRGSIEELKIILGSKSKHKVEIEEPEVANVDDEIPDADEFDDVV